MTEDNIFSQKHNDPRLARVEDYIHESQRAVCEAEDQYIMIEGVAGSRKTDTLIRTALRRHLRYNRSLLFLTQVGSVTDEIRMRIEAYLGILIQKQMGSNHYLATSNGTTIEIANFDAWIHRQLEDCKWPHLVKMGSYHSHKVKALQGMMDKIRGFSMKNGEYADEVYIDECQDFELPRARLIMSFLERLPKVGAVFAGDYLQTLFEKSLDKDGGHPIDIFKSLPEIRRFHLDRCYRCPSPHIDFCNLVMAESRQRHGCHALVAVRTDAQHRPFIFPHGGVSRQFDVHQLARQCCDMLRVLTHHDTTIIPSDVCFLMRRCNEQAVFEYLRVRLEAFWTDRGHPNAVIHFATQHDGYRNSIQWNFAENKTCLLSIHGDKGKSHKVVFVLGVTQKSIPDECSMHKDSELLYESLLNVALTRSTKYLFVGFHHARPSIYLSRVIDKITNEAYLSWRPGDRESSALYRELADTVRFPDPVFISRFRDQRLAVPTLNMTTITDISRRFERAEDLMGFRPKIETVVFGERIKMQLHHDLYPILGYMAELMLLRAVSQTTFRRDIEAIATAPCFYTDDERLLCWARDYHLHRWVGTEMYSQMVRLLMETNASIIQSDSDLSTALARLVETRSYVLPTCFGNPGFRQSLHTITDGQQTSFTSWWNVALLYHEMKNPQRRPCLYKHIGMDFNPRQKRSFGLLVSNIEALARRFSADVVFQPSHDVIAQVQDHTALDALGFVNHPDLDEKFYTHGYHYGIVGSSDIVDRASSTLYEIKASHIDFSVEWLLQASLYASIPFRRTSDGKVETIVLANVATGRLYRWTRARKSCRSLLRTIMELQDFPPHLIEQLYKTNARRLRQQFSKDDHMSKSESN